MKSFSKLVKAADRLHEFNFRQLSGTDRRYHVDVPDTRGNRIIFYMQKDGENHWRVTDLVPEWILHVEDELGEAIEQQEHLWMAGVKS